MSLYSYEPKAKVEISETDDEIVVKVINEGEVLSEEDQIKFSKLSEEGRTPEYFRFWVGA